MQKEEDSNDYISHCIRSSPLAQLFTEGCAKQAGTSQRQGYALPWRLLRRILAKALEKGKGISQV